MDEKLANTGAGGSEVSTGATGGDVTSKGAGGHSALLRQALRAVEQMQQKLHAAESLVRDQTQPIAIVGMGCRYPGGANDAESFWELLREGREAIREIPADRWDAEAYYDPDPTPGKMVSKYGGFLDSVDEFDAAFFGIAPREAAMMDPQQRLLLEVAWAALESGGIAPRSLAESRTGVYLGMASEDYGHIQMEAGDAELLDVHYATGNGRSIASGRLAYLLGLRGPAVTLDTACSSSLVAVHLACQSLRLGECELALAGGVNVMLSPETTVALSQAHMLAPDGRCKAFSAEADGFARAEGCGLVVLKTLKRAEADGDRVFAVIRGSAVNQDGASSSLTAPNGPAQEALMRQALRDAGVAAGAIGLVEAHGTGTALGDPIELRALGAVYGAARAADELLPVSSLKTNFGHMEASAGVGGLMKLVLAMEHEAIPPHLHMEKPTPHVPWGQLKLTVERSLKAWPRVDGKPRLGALSSFGYSGTNAHVILEEAPVGGERWVLRSPTPSNDEAVRRGPRSAQDDKVVEVDDKVVADGDELALLPVSAKSETALRRLVGEYAGWLEGDAGGSWAEIVATAGVGRDHFRYRAAVVAGARGEAAERLRELAAGRGFATAMTAPVRTAPAVGFLFTGQGSERAGMGLELMERSAAFKAAVARLEAALDGEFRFAEIWANRNGELERARYVQPALYAFDWALSEHWRSWGVTPEVVLGHSLGEYVAATVAGVISPEDGIRLVAARGRLTEELGKPGGMVAIVASEAEVRGLLDAEAELSIAAVNGPSSVVVSGELRSLDLLEERITRTGLRHKRLRTTHGFHSRALDGMLDAFEAEAGKIEFKAPEIKWVSNLTGRVVERGHPVDARYWRRHLRETVLFSAGLGAASGASDLLLEVGTEPQLLALADANGIDEARRVASIARAGGEWASVLRAAGRLYCAGMDLDWRAVAADEAGGRKLRRASLPGYPFERQRFWFTDGRRLKVAGSRPRGVDEQSVSSQTFSGLGSSDLDREANGHRLLGARVRMRGDRAVFHGVVSAESPVHLGDHVVMGLRVLPGAAFLEMALAAGRQLEAGRSWDVSEVEFREPCLFDETRLLETVVLAAESADGRRRFEIASAASESDDWTLHVTGWLEVAAPVADLAIGGALDVAGLREKLSTAWDGETLYERLSVAGLGFGPAFRTIAQAWGSAQESLVELVFLPEVAADAGRYGVHPVALDACLQAAAALMEAEQPAAPALPASVERLRVWGDPATLRFATAKVRRRLGRAATVEILGFDAEGNGVLAAEGLTLVEMRAAAPEDEWRGWVQEVVWDEAALAETAQENGRRDVLIVAGEISSLAESLKSVAAEAGAAVTVVSAEAKADGALGAWLAGLKAGANSDAFARKPEIFYLPGAESAVGPEDSALDWQERVLGGALRWTQALIAAERLGQCRLWLISRGAPGPQASESAIAADGATLEAFGRSVRSEDGDAEAIVVDLETDGRADVELLWRQGVDASALGPKYALRGGGVWRPRFAQRALARREDGDETRRLYFAESGLMEDLKPRREARRAPVGDEVEIAIAATAINFHEVLSALNPAHAEGVAPGGECSGVVVRVGPEVADLCVGDEVVAVTAGLMADYATTARERVWRKPAGLSMEDAATVPIAFLTARWCLERVARTQPGEWVLVHAGAGGVGMASIQEAQRLGARVLATAGSEAKRAMLREMGVEGVFDSRSASFAEGVLEATGGRGVDVLLNSLAGDKVAAGLRVMAPGGRFIELGEQTVLSAEERARLRSDIRYEVVQLRDELAVPTAESLETIASVLADFEAGKFRPLPWRRFALDQVADAFRLMAAGLHTGRVLIVPRITDGTKRTVARFAGFRRDGAYLVTGAFGGLGLLMVEWLAKQGAGCVLALGRSAASVETEARLAELRAAGTEVVALRCDVGDEASLSGALQAIPKAYALRGVFHCAGVWANGVLANQTAELYREALAPKVAGGWNLHRLTRDMELDCFVLFSSVAGPMGSRGQSNYAAANAYLDGLAHYRRDQLGLTALSVDWGVWAGVGASVRHGMVERSEKAGAVAISPEKGFALLGRLLEEDCAQVMVSKVDWKKWAGFFPAEYAANADLLAGLMPAAGRDAGRQGESGSDGWLARWTELPAAKRRAQLAARVEERVRGVLGLGSKAAIDAARPLQEYGLDSLLAIELRNALSADLEAKLPQTALFDYPTMGGLTEWLFADVLKAGVDETGQVEEARPEAQIGSGEAVLAGVEELSDEDVERLFELRMAGSKMAGTGR